MKTVIIMRVKRNAMGATPNGFAEGALIGFTEDELEALSKNKHLSECFEEVTIKQRTAYADPAPKPTSETAAANPQSSLSTEQPAVDRKT